MEPSAIKKLQQMSILASYIEQIIWMTSMERIQSKISQLILEVLTIWFLKRNFFNSNFQIKIWNANKLIHLHSIMMKLKMTLKRIKNKVFLINQILVICLWDYRLAKVTKNLFPLALQDKTMSQYNRWCKCTP